MVTVTTVWADERLYYPVHAVPYTPEKHFAKGKRDPAFRTKLAIGADLAAQAKAAGFAFRAVATWYLVTNLPRPGGPARQTAGTRPRSWPRSCGSTASGTG